MTGNKGEHNRARVQVITFLTQNSINELVEAGVGELAHAQTRLGVLPGLAVDNDVYRVAMMAREELPEADIVRILMRFQPAMPTMENGHVEPTESLPAAPAVSRGGKRRQTKAASA